MKRWTACILAIAMLFALAACGGQGAAKDPATTAPSAGQTAPGTPGTPDTPEVNYTFVTPLLSHIVWLVAKDGVDAVGRDFPGLNAVWSGPQNLDAAEQVTYMQMALAEKVDGIATFGTSEEAFAGVFKEIKDAGLQLYTAGGDTPNLHDYLDGGANSNAHLWGYDVGVEAGNKLLEKGEDTAYVAEFLYALDSSLALGVMAGYEAGLADAGLKVEVLGQWESKSDASVALDSARTVFLTYPEVNTIMTCGGECAGAIATAMKEVGKTGEDVVVVGDGVQDDCLAAIEEGMVFATICQNYFAYGYIPGMWLYMYEVYGEDVSDFYDVPVTIIHKGETVGYDKTFYDGQQWFDLYYPSYDWNEVTGK